MAEGAACSECGTRWAVAMLSCPGCQRLVHGQHLRTLAADARTHAGAGRVEEALGEAS